MKNTLITICIIVTFLFIYFLQVNFFSWFTIAGVQPNLFVILIVFVALFARKNISIPFSILAGIILDALMGKRIGISAILFGIIAILGIYFDKNFSKESKLTIILMIVGATFLYEAGRYLLLMLPARTGLEIAGFIKILAIEIGYHVLLNIILYPIMKMVGHYVEEESKGTRILTRYF